MARRAGCGSVMSQGIQSILAAGPFLRLAYEKTLSLLPRRSFNAKLGIKIFVGGWDMRPEELQEQIVAQLRALQSEVGVEELAESRYHR